MDKLTKKQKGGELLMQNSNPNKCIKCSVQECEYHCDDKDYCSLDSIMIGTHEQNPTEIQCTDCESFKYKG